MTTATTFWWSGFRRVHFIVLRKSRTRSRTRLCSSIVTYHSSLLEPLRKQTSLAVPPPRPPASHLVSISLKLCGKWVGRVRHRAWVLWISFIFNPNGQVFAELQKFPFIFTEQLQLLQCALEIISAKYPPSDVRSSSFVAPQCLGYSVTVCTQTRPRPVHEWDYLAGEDMLFAPVLPPPRWSLVWWYLTVHGLLFYPEINVFTK